MNTIETEKPIYHKVTTPENYPDDDKKSEQSDRSHLLEHHVRIEKLERKAAYLQDEIWAMENRRRIRQKEAAILLMGICYGLLVGYLLLS